MNEYGLIRVKCKHAIHNDIDSYCMAVADKNTWPHPKCLLTGSIVDSIGMCPPIFSVSWTYFIIKKQYLIKIGGF